MAEEAPFSKPSGPAEPGRDDLELVRELLLGREKSQISRLEERIENKEVRARDVGRVLPEAVRACADDGNADSLTRALTPAIETALQDSVQRRPSILTNAIFPIIGPAIRRASAEAISRLVQSVNHALEHSFSWRGLTWRLEALRTGRSYAEIVLCRTVLYRVEQVFLIHASSGLLLHHVAQSGVPEFNGDLISGMLTAIHDFVSDSFRVTPGERLHVMEVGGLTVWLETGPYATLAAVIRGHPPASLRRTLQTALERVHEEFAVALRSPDRDGTAFIETTPILAECLLGQEIRSAGRSLRPFWFAVLVVTGVVGWFLVSRFIENQRWTSYLRRLAGEEGILVAASSKHGGRFHLVGWRDPLAVDPSALLAEFHLSTNQVISRWEPYRGLTPTLVLQRARRILNPPDGVTLRFEAGVLHAEGVAPSSWVTQAKLRAPSVPGIDAFDADRLFDPPDNSLEELAASARAVEQTLLFFGDTIRLLPEQEVAVSRLADQIKRLHQAAREAGRSCRITVIGHTDRTGTPDYNLRLSRQRADEVVALLSSHGVPTEWFETKGIGDAEPLVSDLAATEQVRNRRASFRVGLAAETPTPAPP
ncbi:MAG: OmpA family protein [Limisphaerales bacterium]